MLRTVRYRKVVAVVVSIMIPQRWSMITFKHAVGLNSRTSAMNLIRRVLPVLTLILVNILPRSYIGLIGHWEGSVFKIVILLMVYIVEVIFQVGRLHILIYQNVAKTIVGIRPLLVKDVPMYHIEDIFLGVVFVWGALDFAVI